MDDKTSNNTPTSVWLSFALAFDASARYCQHMRQAQPDPSVIGSQIRDYRAGQHLGLCDALKGKLDASALREITSERVKDQANTARQWADKNPAHHLLGLDDPAYPAQLRETIDAPPLLYAKGHLCVFAQPALAIVGSRKAGKQSLDLTYRLAAAMAARGVTIVSGLARGIDAAAHEGALSVGGRTIAVAATAPDQIYPKQHSVLEQTIIEQGGLIVTEYPLGAKTLRWFFPRRNRIISGLSLGVLVAEAGLPSGTLTTATHAINQGREVMAIPGSAINPQFRGCHSLIKQGATLVEDEQDILDALAWPLLRSIEDKQAMHSARQQQENLNFSATSENSPIEARILNALRETPSTIDELMTQTQITVKELGTHLGMLEIEGKISASSGGRYNLVRN